MYERPIVESLLKTVEEMDSGVEATASAPLSVSSINEEGISKLKAIASDASCNPLLAQSAAQLLKAIEGRHE